MLIPLNIWDVTLLFAMFSIVLLVTSVFSSCYGKSNLLVDKKKLRYITLVASFAFLAAIFLRIIYFYLIT